jgi:single-strand DNA-binding protein
MPGSFNRVIIMGNLTRDPETRTIPSGNTVTKFSIATNRKFQGRDGNQQEEVAFIDCEAWGKPAEIIDKYMSKGRSMLVEGRLKFDSWESQQGEKRSKLLVVVENFQFTGGRGEDGDGDGGGYGGGNREGGYERSSPPQRSNSGGGQRAQSSRQPAEDFDDDVPF